jgi:hypothetical protein
MIQDIKWLTHYYPHLINHAVSLWRQSVPHQMFNIPIPWKLIRREIETIKVKMESVKRKIEEQKAKQGSTYKGGLLELVAYGSADFFNAVEYTMNKQLRLNKTL